MLKMEKTISKPYVDRSLVATNPKNEECSEISIKEFLDFLRTAYQVTDSVEETLSSVEGTADVVNWIKLKNTELVKPKPISCQTSSTNIDKNVENENVMKSKLDAVLNEGLLDSVLPYLVPNNPNKKSGTKMSDKSSSSSTRSSSSKDSLGRRKSESSCNKAAQKTDSEVEIHVCDEVKNIKKDFICSQKLLVEKMGYFAEVTSGQKLEDMDISVHCDIGIFEWLMRWVKQDLIPEEDWPKLDSQCVIPILVSAAFLQMEPLLQDCLFYCHENMNEILQSTSNLNCLNDSIVSRLAAMYTNSELESIKDKRDKIQSRLYCKMIGSLCDPVCESVRGHWNSLSRIFRCVKCEQLVMPEVAKMLPCHPTAMSINRYGQLLSSHIRDQSWNINDYIIGLQSQLKTWRKVYWHLWGDCHYLFCTVCLKPFPAHKLKWCCYHAESPQFFTIDSQKSPLPVGRYPCCGDRAYKFQLLNNYSGCQFREHLPRTVKARDAAVFAILEEFRSAIDSDPPDLIFPERLTRLVARDNTTTDGKLICKEVFWWDGLQLVPPQQSCGLLGPFVANSSERSTPDHDKFSPVSFDDDSSSESSSSSSGHSEESRARSPTKPNRKRKVTRKKPKGKGWQMNLSARSNQDIQRANEETTLTKMVGFLSKKSSLDQTLATSTRHKGYMRHMAPPGGVYMRLEADWKENSTGSAALKRIYNSNRTKIRATRLV